MADLQDVSRHYTQGNLLAAIERGLGALGRTRETATLADLAPVDEFHIGGREASEAFLAQLGLSSGMQVLDIGCGLGGAARFVADCYKCRVTGIDLTPEFVETGNALCRWVGLQDSVSLRQGSALSLELPDASYDGAYMLHVGMNIPDKAKVCAEASRVLRRGARFGIYDVMRTGDGELIFPVPWATSPDASAVAEPDHYKKALEAAGFAVLAERSRRDFALAFFDRMRLAVAAAGGPPPLGLHLVMGKNTPEKVKNMIENISAGRIAPIELIARKA